MYVTFKVSPDTTARSPTVKLPAENKVPEVPFLVLSVVTNAPAIVPEAFMVKTTGDETMTEGSAVVAVPNAIVGRLACE